MKSDEFKTIVTEGTKITVKYNKEYETVKVGDIFFSSKEDFIYFVNKLTDIAEEFQNENI